MRIAVKDTNLAAMHLLFQVCRVCQRASARLLIVFALWLFRTNTLLLSLSITHSLTLFRARLLIVRTLAFCTNTLLLLSLTLDHMCPLSRSLSLSYSVSRARSLCVCVCVFFFKAVRDPHFLHKLKCGSLSRTHTHKNTNTLFRSSSPCALM